MRLIFDRKICVSADYKLKATIILATTGIFAKVSATAFAKMLAALAKTLSLRQQQNQQNGQRKDRDSVDEVISDNVSETVGERISDSVSETIRDSS